MKAEKHLTHASTPIKEALERLGELRSNDTNIS